MYLSLILCTGVSDEEVGINIRMHHFTPMYKKNSQLINAKSCLLSNAAPSIHINKAW